MIRRLRDFRLIPIVLLAIICLFALKTFGLIFDGGYTLPEPAGRGGEPEVTGSVGAQKRVAVPPAQRKQSWAQEMFNFPDVTGATAEKKPVPPPVEGAVKDERVATKTPSAPQPAPAPPAQRERPLSPAERALLERLGERRAELEARARDLDMRESLLLAAEKRLEARITELKELEARVNNAAQAKSDEEAAQFKNLVTMYENMKAKDAAKIFDRLDLRVLIEVASQLNPRRMSDIMALMAPEAAERLTLELAARAKSKGTATELPKIEGKPVTN
jgi:flagellar motility protein MotE (MotC chaperone)